jgi:hypothetical protein
MRLLPPEARAYCSYIAVYTSVHNIYIFKTLSRDYREIKIRQNDVCKVIHNENDSEKF